MKHDPNIVLLGGRLSTIMDISCEDGDPRIFKAGIAVRLDSTDKIALPGGSPLAGVSMGESLTGGDFNKISVARVGNYVPLLLNDLQAAVKIGDITFTAKNGGIDGNEITITISDDLIDGSASVSVAGSDITISIESGVTEAQVIVAAIEEDSEASALILAVADSGDEDAPQSLAAETPLTGGTSFTPVVGTKVNIASNGKASATGTATSAIYLSARKSGVYPDGSTHPCCLIGLIGGF